MPGIQLDRDLETPVQTQLAEQLRYLIASGHFKINDPLPSTRELGDDLGVSFHTVRKAYQTLESEGLLQSKPGSGYTVKERAPLPKAERMERGAEIVAQTLQRLIGYGLSEAEIEALFQEQATLLDHAGLERKLIVVGPHPEINEMCADQLSSALQQPVRPVPLAQLSRHQDAEFAFTSHPHVPTVLKAIPRGDVLGFVTHLPSSVLERVVRLLDQEILGLVTRYQDTIAPLSEALRTAADYDGQILATSIEEEADALQSFLDDTDLLLYTPNSKRRAQSALRNTDCDQAEARLLVSQDSVDAILEAIPA